MVKVVILAGPSGRTGPGDPGCHLGLSCPGLALTRQALIAAGRGA